MAPESSRLVRRATLALMALAAAAVEVAAGDGRAPLEAVGWTALWVALAAGAGRLVRAPEDGSQTPPRTVLLLLLALASAPFLVEMVRRSCTEGGSALEVQMVFALHNAGLGLAAFASWKLCLRLAGVVSLFLMLFAVTMTEHPLVLTLLGLYSATGSVWLMLVYWSELRRFLVTSETAIAAEVQPGRERLPWRALLVVLGLVGPVLGLIAAGPRAAVTQLGEWLPTSGGTGAYDPYARGGVNDGDDEVKGANARSTGMVETDTLLDSPLPSLYDMISEMYGEPFKPKDPERAIALDAQPPGKEGKKPPADNLRPNREFPTTRKSPARPRESATRAARALFEVQGRTPLHVRVATFDLFDGLAWQEAPIDLSTCRLAREPRGNWMRAQAHWRPVIFAETEGHKLKITAPLGRLVPAPPHLERFKVGRVDQPDFFAWGQDRILRMAQRKTPAGIIVETESGTVDPRNLGAIHFRLHPQGKEQTYGTLPANLDPEVEALARRWAAGRPEGWAQIEAVVSRLREEYELDPTARVPDDCHDPLGHFLLHSRRGPDYQFAGAAALLLRVLGYPTRLVSGFHVAPARYDALTGHTPVGEEDLHFWAEVQLPCGDWLVLEPTPGYEVLRPRLSLAQRLEAALLAMGSWAWQNSLALGLSLLALAGLWWRRRELLDVLAVAAWHWFPGRTWQQRVRRALALLERRGRWAGRPRRASQTVTTWLRSTLPGAGSRQSELGRLMALAEWTAYSPFAEPPWRDEEVDGLCRRVLGAWTLKRWRGLARPSSVPSTESQGA